VISLTSISFFVVFVVPVSGFIDFYMISCCFRCACQWFHWLLYKLLLFSLCLSVVSLISIWFLVVFVVPVTDFIDFYMISCCSRCACQWFHWFLYDFFLFSLCLSMISLTSVSVFVVFVVPVSGFIDFYMICCCFRCACQWFHWFLFDFLLFSLCLSMVSLIYSCWGPESPQTHIGSEAVPAPSINNGVNTSRNKGTAQMQRTLSENSAMHNKNNTKWYKAWWKHWQAQRKQQEII